MATKDHKAIVSALHGDVGYLATQFFSRLGSPSWKGLARKLDNLSCADKQLLHNHMLDYGTAAAKAAADFLRERIQRGC